MPANTVEILIKAVNQAQAGVNAAAAELKKLQAGADALGTAVKKPQTEMQRLREELRQLKAPAELDKLRRQIEELKNPTQQAARGMDEMNRGAKSANAGFGSLAKGIFGVVSVLTVLRATWTAANRVKDDFFETITQVEGLKASMEVTYGSVKKANEMFDLFDRTARKVPQTLLEVNQAGATLQNFDKNLDMKKWLAPSLDLISKVQMMNKNVDAKEIATNLGRSLTGGIAGADLFREMGITGLIGQFAKLKYGINDITKVEMPQFRKIMYEALTDESLGIAGTSERLSHTLRGQISMLKDFVTRFYLDVSEGGFMSAISKQVQEFRMRLEELERDGTLKRWAVNISQALITGVEWLVKAAKAVATLYQVIKEHQQVIKATAVFLALALAIQKLVLLAADAKIALLVFQGSLSLLTPAAAGAAGGMTALSGAVKTLGLTVSTTTLAITGIAGALYLALNAWTDWINRDTEQKNTNVENMNAEIQSSQRRNKFARNNKGDIKNLNDVLTGKKQLSDFSSEEVYNMEKIRYEAASEAENRRQLAARLKPVEKEVPVKGYSTFGSYTQYVKKTFSVADQMKEIDLKTKKLFGIMPQMAEGLAPAFTAEFARRGIKRPEVSGTVTDRHYSPYKMTNAEAIAAGVGGAPDVSTSGFKFTTAGFLDRLKGGAQKNGASVEGVYALMQFAKDSGILGQVTALNDSATLHGGKGHKLGLAGDFTLTDPKQSAAVASRMRALMAAIGVKGAVKDEYLHPSKNATGGHIHAQFASTKDADLFAKYYKAQLGGDIETMTAIGEDKAAADLDAAEKQQKKNEKAKQKREAAERAYATNVESMGRQSVQLLTNLQANFEKNRKKISDLRKKHIELTQGPFAAEEYQAGLDRKASISENTPYIGRARAAADAELEYSAKMADIEKRREADKQAKSDEEKRRADEQLAQQRALEDLRALNATEFEKRRTAAAREREDRIDAAKGNAAALLAIERNYVTELTEIRKAEREARKEQERAFFESGKGGSNESFMFGFRESMEKVTTWGQQMLSVGRTAATGLHQAFSDSFFSLFSGDINNLSDLWQQFCTDLKNAFVRAMAEMVAQKMMANLFGGLFGGKGGGNAGGGGGGGGKDSWVGDALSVAAMFAANGGIIPGGLRGIQYFANGGIVRRPTLAFVGEGGQNEAVVPLPDGRHIPVKGMGGGNTVIHNHYHSYNAIDSKTFMESFAAAGGPQLMAAVAQQSVSQGAADAVLQSAERGHNIKDAWGR